MKFVYKENIPGFLALPHEKQKEIEKLARKGVAKPKAILLQTFSFVIAFAIPFLGNKWKPALGEEAHLVSAIAILPLALLLLFVSKTMIINPQIEQLMKNRPSKSGEPA